MEIKEFNQLGITPSTLSLIGKSIQIETILDKQIIIHNYAKRPSTKRLGTTCVHVQIEFENEMRVLFSGGEILNEMILKVGKENCPVRTTIKKVNRHYELS